MEAIAKLKYLPVSARKVALLADLVRGKRVSIALAALQNSPQQAAVQLRKLLLSAMANWYAKHSHTAVEEAPMVVKKITVDRAGMLKRIMPAPRGVAHRIRRRSSHIVVVVGSQVEQFAIG